MLEPGDILVDCTGSKSVLRDHLVPGADETDAGANTLNIRLEHALVITFLYGQSYECNEYCKYYKNAGNDHYKFIPSVHRTYYRRQHHPRDGHRHHHGRRVRSDAAAVRRRLAPRQLPRVAESMDRFIDKIKEETHGELIGELAIVRIPLNLYRARNATSRQWRTKGPFYHPFASSPVFLLGDSAIGSPYFQSISLGFECAMFLARLIAQRDLPLKDMLDRYELLHVQAVVSRLHAQQDDQAQQGSAPMRRRQIRAPRSAARLLDRGLVLVLVHRRGGAALVGELRARRAARPGDGRRIITAANEFSGGEETSLRVYEARRR